MTARKDIARLTPFWAAVYGAPLGDGRFADCIYLLTEFFLYFRSPLKGKYEKVFKVNYMHFEYT